MRNKWSIAILTCALALMVCQPAQADSFSFDTLPSGGDIYGMPGSTVGWGYRITNNSATNWLSIVGLSAGSFTLGTGDGSIFNYPILKFGESLVVAYNAATFSGLYEFTWGSTVTLGSVESGIFTLTGEWFDGDPFAGGASLGFEDQMASYSVTAVPEPATWLLLASGLVIMISARRRFVF